MKKRNIFVYTLFLSLNISDFSSSVYVKIAPPPPPSKSFQRGEGVGAAHYEAVYYRKCLGILTN